MRLKSPIGLALAAMALPLATAQAADYDPPIYVDEAPEYTPVEIGSGWYLRGDVAYTTEQDFERVNFGFTPVDYDEQETPLFASIGFGYHLNDYLRAELNLGYIPGNEQSASYDDGTTAAFGKVENHAWTGMLNGYVDLGTYVGITPYIGAGVGVYQSHREASAGYVDADPLTDDFDAHDDETQYSFAYTLNAGFAYQMSKNLSLDVGYQYLSAPDAEVAVLTNSAPYTAVEKGIDYHQIKVGLRYDLW
jgi:opacity protein-like surface antigen